MYKVKSKRSSLMNTTEKSKAEQDTNVHNVDEDLYDESSDFLNEEVWEFMNEQEDDLCFD